MKGPLSDRLRVQHILDAIGEVEAYIAGVTEEKFLESSEKDLPPLSKLK